MTYVNPTKFSDLDPANWRDYEPHYTQAWWPSDLPSKPADYGSNAFPGRTHPEIIFVAGERYAKFGELVWDCFGGSGTTLDVCKEIGLKCVANDIRPTREDIIARNSCLWHPSKNIQLAICHPPYLNVVDYAENDELEIFPDLTTGNLKDWNDMMRDVFDNITKVLDMNRVLVTIVGSVYNESRVIPLECEIYPMLTPKYRLLGRVVRPFGETKGGSTAGKKNENLWRYRRLKYGIWALDVDTVMFWQKVSD